jgi:thiol-disulfide isomerase/thioredoxin
MNSFLLTIVLVFLVVRYVSTMTNCQKIISENGIVFGPGKTDEYIKNVGRASFLTSPDCCPIVPPANVGTTMTNLMKEGVIFTSKQKEQHTPKSKLVRGWSLPDYWEQTTWPRDSAGGANVRFGLPVVDDPTFDDDDDDDMVAEPPPRKRQAKNYLATSRKAEELERLEEAEQEQEQQAKQQQENPYVKHIVGVQGMQEEIADAHLDCLVFLSARFCKTCKTLDPQFTRLARLQKDSSITFVKAETAGLLGKELGKALEVDAVPAFVLFRKGVLFGTPLSASRLPSSKITQALELLESGKDWDSRILFQKDDSNSS